MSTQYTNTILLIRHGENLANVTGEFSYKRVDYSLTAKGVLQAQQTAAFLRDQHIDEFFSSPLKRAHETAEIIAEPHHLPVTIFEEFRELNVGDLEDAAPTAENWDYHNSIFVEWSRGRLDTSFPNGESFITLTERGKRGLHKATWGKQGRVIAIAGHAAIFTSLVSAICGSESLEIIRQGKKHNCSITEIELTTSEHDVVGKLVQWAACAHLSGEAANFVPAVPEFKQQAEEIIQ